MTSTPRSALLVVLLLAGCADELPCETWRAPTQLDLDGTSAQLLAIGEDVVVGANGTLVARGELQTLPVGVDADLLAAISYFYQDNASGPGLLAVGKNGTVLSGRASDFDGPYTWTLVDVGTSADLRGIVAFELLDNLIDLHVAVVGEGVVIERTPSYDFDLGETVFSWTTVEPPPAGWGSLRGMSLVDGSPRAVGDAGRILTRERYEAPEWTAGKVDTDEDLLAHCSSDLGDRMVGGEGTLFTQPAGVWAPYELGIGEGVIACDGSIVLTDSGRVLEVDVRSETPEIVELATRAGLRAVYRHRRTFYVEPYPVSEICVEAVGDAGLSLEVCPCEGPI